MRDLEFKEWHLSCVTPPVTEQICFFCEEPTDTEHDICSECIEEHGEGLLDAFECIVENIVAEKMA